MLIILNGAVFLLLISAKVTLVIIIETKGANRRARGRVRGGGRRESEGEIM